MNDHTYRPHGPFPSEGPEPTREDVLIGRVVDGEASTSDWDALDVLARADASVWERLGRAQRTHARLEREVEDAIAIAELIDAPSRRVAGGGSLVLRVRQYGGWAAAAAVALSWAAFQGPGVHGRSGGNQAGLGQIPIATLTPDQALEQYVSTGVAQGRVLGEMQPMLVDARDLGEGKGKEVWYVRPILERRTVTDLNVLSVEMDEHGTARYVPLPVDGPGVRGPAIRTRTRSGSRGGEAL